jgi:hypothetical protein
VRFSYVCINQGLQNENILAFANRKDKKDYRHKEKNVCGVAKGMTLKGGNSGMT